MGYYTAFRLNVKNVRSAVEYKLLCKALSPFGIFDLDPEPRCGLAEPKCGLVTFYSSDTYKWYNFEEDMQNVSQSFPHMTFMLEGDGEDYDDFWIEYFQNGHHELCVGSITYPDPVSIPWDNIPDISIPTNDLEIEKENWSQILDGENSK